MGYNKPPILPKFGSWVGTQFGIRGFNCLGSSWLTLENKLIIGTQE